jgi:hypothetical protein
MLFKKKRVNRIAIEGRNETNSDLENPLDLLRPDEIKQITSDTVTQLFASVNSEFEKALEDQKAKFMAQVAKMMGQ